MTDEQIDKIATELYEVAMQGARPPMRRGGVSFGVADRVATGVHARFSRWVAENQERLASLGEEEVAAA